MSELAALKWGDFNFQLGTMHVQRGVVLGSIDEVKTLASDAFLPVAPELAAMLQNYKCMFQPQATAEDWLFPSPVSGQPYSTTHIQSGHIDPAGRKAGLGEGIGWHNFRHSYSTLLRALKVDMKVQQALMRHADLRTTMNVYTQAVEDNLRQAHAAVMQAVVTADARRWLQAEGQA